MRKNFGGQVPRPLTGPNGIDLSVMQNAEAQRKAAIDQLMIQTSMTIYSGLVTKNATPMKPEELRAAAKAAISSAPAGDGRPKTVRGIEYNSRNQPTAYWLYTNHPFDTWGWGAGGQSDRIPADRVIHTYLADRPSMHRGVTWFGASVQSMRDIDWYLGNEMTAAATGALLTLIVKRKTGQGAGIGFLGGPTSTAGNTDIYGNSNVKLGSGIVADLGSEDDIKVAESNRPNRDLFSGGVRISNDHRSAGD